MKYQVDIVEKLARTETVNAKSVEDAEEKVRQLYRNEDIVLDADDFRDVDFLVHERTRKQHVEMRLMKVDAHNEILSFYKSPNRDFTLLSGDCMELLPQFDFKFDMIFADPPYFLSNGGISYQSGKVVCVDKGEWDKGGTPESVNEFNLRWLKECRDKLKRNGTIWISGTYHNIFSIANALQTLGFRILNVVTWAKTNPPPNISCRFFTYSTEFVIWARKEKKTPHYFNYSLMRSINGNKQMTDVWRLPAIAQWEKSCGKHPTQKPLCLLTRIVLASTKPGAWILDPFAGSSTTGIAANLLGRRFLGIEREKEFLTMSRKRREEIENLAVAQTYLTKINKQSSIGLEPTLMFSDGNELAEDLFIDLPF